jgi:hypothetical protein
MSRGPIVLAVMMMLTFLVDQTQQLCCALFRAVAERCGSKRGLWESARPVLCRRTDVDAPVARSPLVRSEEDGPAVSSGFLVTLTVGLGVCSDDPARWALPSVTGVVRTDPEKYHCLLLARCSV